MPDCTSGATSDENVTTGSDDFVAGLAAEQIDREAQRRRAGVDHHAVLLREQLGDLALELLDPRPQIELRRAQHFDDRLDLALVVRRSGFGDAPDDGLSSTRSVGTAPVFAMPAGTVNATAGLAEGDRRRVAATRSA